MIKITIKTALAIMIYAIITNSNLYSRTLETEKDLKGKTVSNIPENNIQTIQLKFELENDGFVNLIIYKSNGEIAETIVEGEMEAGVYNVYFKTAERIEAEKYYYIITVDGELKLKKLLTFQS